MRKGPQILSGTPKTVGLKTVGVLAPLQRRDGTVSLDELAKEWLLELRVMGRSATTIEFYEQKLRQFRRESPVRRLSELTAFELKRYLGELRERGLSDHTIHGHYQTIKALASWADREGYPVEGALLIVRAPKVAQQEMETFTQVQQRVLLETAPEGWQRLAVQILLGTGMRLGELVALTVDDVEEDDGLAFLKIRRGKGAKFRRAPLSDRLFREVTRYLNRWRPDTSSPALLIQRSGRPVIQDTVGELFRRLRLQTGMAVRAHKLRHTFATEYLRAGGDIERLRRILGHTTYVMVMRYVHLDKGDLHRDFNQRSPF
jgi:integrase/recombinase XerD